MATGIDQAMVNQIISHPQFWAVVGLSWGIASDILGSSRTVKANGVTQLVLSLISQIINQAAADSLSKQRRQR